MRPVYKKHLMTMGLIWAISLLLLSLAYVFMIVPQGKKLKAVNDGVVDRRQQYQLAKEAGADDIMVEWQSELEKLKNRFTEFVTDFEDSSNLSFAISRILNNIGAISSASIESPPQSYSEISGSEHLAQISTKIQFTATFNQFALVINSLERHKPVFFIDSFSISRSKGPELKTSHEVSMNLTSLVRKPAEQEDAIRSTVDQDSSLLNSTAGSVNDSAR
jgi:hypothetical protein